MATRLDYRINALQLIVEKYKGWAKDKHPKASADKLTDMQSRLDRLKELKKSGKDYDVNIERGQDPVPVGVKATGG